MNDTFQDVIRTASTVHTEGHDGVHRWAADTPAGVGQPEFTGYGGGAAGYRKEATLLAGLRLALLAALLAGMWLMEVRLDVDLPLAPLIATAGALGLSAAFLLSCVRRGTALSTGQLTAQLLLDIALLSFALYWVGGSITNPFADLYVLFVCFAAITLPWRSLGVILLAVVAGFSFLAWNHKPLPLHHGAFSVTDLDNFAHWVHFVLTGSLVALFGHRLAQVHRVNRESLAQAREEQARRETALNFASLAAGTAHEMGTPLTTITMLVDDMSDEPGLSPGRRREFDVIRDAISECKRSLREMVEAVSAESRAQQAECPVDALLESTLERARALRPGITFSLAIDGPSPAPLLRTTPLLRQALLNVLNNAADASPDNVDVRVNWSPTHVYIDILDRGPGMPAELRSKLGKCVLSRDERGAHGNGLGAFLASMTAMRHGGRIEFLPRFGGGTCARVRLPTLDATPTK